VFTQNGLNTEYDFQLFIALHIAIKLIYVRYLIDFLFGLILFLGNWELSGSPLNSRVY
jgi:hypothetical protein